jgi:L-2-amino-thiazoline-4-carboxylic acid hydrolase
MMPHDMPSDTLNEIGVLRRREIEARILAPVVDALGAEFGRERVIEIVKRVIVEIAHQQGRSLASQAGANTLDRFARSKTDWVKGEALETTDLALTETTYEFNVTRCRYAEMYRALGIPELGTVLSCGRDFALGEGFNPDLKLARTQTLMEGAPHCDFRYRLEEDPKPQ